VPREGYLRSVAIGSAQPAALRYRRSRANVLLWTVLALVLALVAFAGAVLLMSRASLASDPTALARVETGPLAGDVARVEASGPGGRAVPLRLSGGRLTPLRRLRPGEVISVAVTLRRPGWLAWALGAEHTERLTLRTPAAAVSQRWLTVPAGDEVSVPFDEPVSAVAFNGAQGPRRETLQEPSRAVAFRVDAPTGTVAVRSAVRPWESLGTATKVSWFPPSHEAVLASYPAPGSAIAPAAPIELTFSEPVSHVLGSARPRLSPSLAGSWRETDTHTLVFTPAGYGAPLASALHLELPHAVAVSSGPGRLATTGQVGWYVPTGSTVRLQQLLAQAGYLPLEWRPAGREVARTPAAEVAAAIDPPSGSFAWRYGDTPSQLQRLWSPGTDNEITRGAIMKFEGDNGMTADGVGGAAVWRALIRGAIAGNRSSEPYSYVYVHREVPETATLWSAGRTVIVSAANTGIAGAETEVGTFPVFEHIPEGTMSGTNPDGSHYEDPGIKWISYFNGGDALHNFDRASFGTPQSLGCVELPLAAAAEIWHYTPIGTLVTIEA